MSVLQRAHRLLALGLSVIPVPRAGACTIRGEPCDGKTPVVCWKQFQSRFPTHDELAAWFTSDALNLAVLTGDLSGVVVVDIDARDVLEWCRGRLPSTPWQVRTRKGLHLWYQHPGHHVGNPVRLRIEGERLPIDLRGDGGFVMVPPSVHASGFVYRELGNWEAPREALPLFNPDWLPVVPAPSSSRHEEVTNQLAGAARSPVDALARARAYLAVIPPPVIGAGSDAATFTAACRLVRGFNLHSTDAERLLWEWCGNRPGWTREWIQQKVLNAEKHGHELRGAML